MHQLCHGRGVHAFIHIALACSILAATGCAREAAVTSDETAEESRVSSPVKTLGGGLMMTVSEDLIVHPHRESILATSVDGGFRLFVGHGPPEKLMRHAGAAKGVLQALGWSIEGEQHYEQAVLLRFQLKKSGKDPAMKREMWVVSRHAGVITCDAIADPSNLYRLGQPLRTLCQDVVLLTSDVTPLAPADAEGG